MDKLFGSVHGDWDFIFVFYKIPFLLQVVTRKLNMEYFSTFYNYNIMG